MSKRAFTARAGWLTMFQYRVGVYVIMQRYIISGKKLIYRDVKYLLNLRDKYFDELGK